MSPRLSAAECWTRLAAARHGVLATRHAGRGVDAVPVVYVLDACTPDAGTPVDTTGRVVLPVDTVKAKTSTRLQRLANLAADPRCVLLVEHYDDDWSALWWVRLHATARVVRDDSGSAGGELERLRTLLADRFAAYRPPASVVAAIVLEPLRAGAPRPGGLRPAGPRGAAPRSVADHSGRGDAEEADKPAITGWSAS